LEIEPTDLEALAADLVRRGVTVDGTPGRRWGAQGYGRSLYVRDPDGNKVELKCYGE
jgi:extradiol dioxygenase family protein